MTIDEAVAREKRICEENQKVVDTHIICEDVTLEEFYCDDTEVIEEHLNNYKFASRYHKQIAEWLEELKSLRSASEWWEHNNNLAYVQGRKDAIDEFVTRAYRKLGCSEQELYCSDFIDEIAEQLKEK